MTSERKTWFGHPRGLAISVSAELWERFSYYGMRALLVLYLIHALGRSESEAYALHGVYGAVVYKAYGDLAIVRELARLCGWELSAGLEDEHFVVRWTCLLTHQRPSGTVD